MRLFLHFVSLFCVTLIPLAHCSGESHRALVVSATNARLSGEPCEICVVEIESGSVLARTQVGDIADAALTPASDLVGVTSVYDVARASQPHARLEIFKSSDLSLVQKGFIPVRRATYIQVPFYPRTQFSPDGKELLIQRMEWYRSDEAPVRHTVEDIVLTRLQLKLDDAGMFKIAGQPFKVPRARSVDFLRTAEWPRITVWNHHLGAIEVLDLSTSEILSRVPLGDDPVLTSFDPRHLEKPNIGDVTYRLGFRAHMLASDGKWGYYVPQHSPQDTTRRPFGYLRKIDLTADPPKVVRTTDQRQPNLRARVSTVSETAGALFVAEDKRDSDSRVLPSPLVKTFHTLTLAPAGDILTSLTNCDCLAASHDGKYLYAVDFGGGMSVVDISSGKEVKVLKDVGNHPALVLALP